MINSLESLISNRRATVAVVGLGYVGLPLLLRFSEVGFPVVGIDIDPAKPASLSSGQSYLSTVPSTRVRSAVNRGMKSTTDISCVADADAIILCLPTPLGAHKEPNLSYVEKTVESIAPYLRRGHVISLESTTYPGTTDEVVRPKLERVGLTLGKDWFLLYSPEREDPGNLQHPTHTIPKVISGITKNCQRIAALLYGAAFNELVPVSTVGTAELTKLLENIYRAVNIGLVNELKVVADKMGLDIYEIIRAAATKPFGFTAFFPGPGLGGHCIPIDPFYLTWKAREYGVHTHLIEVAGEVNSAMPSFVVDKVIDGLNSARKSVNGSKILVLGVSYKKNVGDTRESPSIAIMQRLSDLGAELQYADPHVPRIPRMREYALDLESVELNDEALSGADCVLVATDHDWFDYNRIADKARLIVDARGRYSADTNNVIRA